MVIGELGDSIGAFVSEKPIATAVIGAGAVGAGVLGAAAVVKSRRKTKKKTKKSTTKRKRKKTTKKKKRNYKYARTAGKRKDTSTRRIRMTKNGQPYVILKSGKARFIKKSSARRSRKLKGGRY
jgi:Flp pilus assembly protein TadB